MTWDFEKYYTNTRKTIFLFSQDTFETLVRATVYLVVNLCISSIKFYIKLCFLTWSVFVVKTLSFVYMLSSSDSSDAVSSSDSSVSCTDGEGSFFLGSSFSVSPTTCPLLGRRLLSVTLMSATLSSPLSSINAGLCLEMKLIAFIGDYDWFKFRMSLPANKSD